jgi:hypothetical protein
VTTEITPNITGANIFQTVTWDLSGVSDANKDAIDSVVITVVNADAANTFYLDNMYYTASAKDIIFSTAGSETERINSSGHLGIGAASPLALLTVGSSTPAYLLSSQYYNSAYIGGQLEVGGTATSTFAGNVNVIGDLFAKTTKLGDLGFANNFKFVEDPMPINDQLVAGTQALVLKNQRGEDILKIDENGNLIVPGAISSQSLASGSPLAGGGNLIADSLSWILEQFKNIGITIADGVMSLKKLVVSDEVCIGSTCIDESQLKELINKNGIGQTPPASNEATSTTTPDIITPTEPLTTESSSTEPVSTPI